MKVVQFKDEAGLRLGFLVGDRIIDALAAMPASDPACVHFADAGAFIRGADTAREVADRILRNPPAQSVRNLSSVRLGPPLLPTTILCSGSNYHAHNAEKANTPISGKEPEFFVMTADNVVGPDDKIVYDPSYTKKLDCETELAIVIGKGGRHIPRERALEHVFGYTIVNDVTARDLQVRTSPQGSVWYEVGRGKMFDTSSPLGPVIVTADEVPDPQKLDLRTRINGDLRQQTSTGDMIFSCAELIHFFSAGITLKPGMVIITGTPAGTSWSNDPELGGKWTDRSDLVKPTRYCLPGDVIECEVEKIGILRNTVAHI